jgi:acyl-CoA synthetase (AMP-forming)/AMP-acid ligase II/acyl carrier protein
MRLQHHAREQAGRTALSFLDEHGSIQHSWTFGDVDRIARSVGSFLHQQGYTGKPVVLAYPSGLEFISAFCACLYSGVIAVPASLPRSNHPDERMPAILSNSGATVVLTCSRSQTVIERHLAAAGLRIDVIATDSLEDQSEQWSPVQGQPDQLAFLQYTSGSTRTPSGVMVSHGNLAANLEYLCESLCTHRQSVGVSWLPLFHDMGLIAGILAPLWVGYPTFLMTPAAFVQNPLGWLRVISRYHGTISGGPNFAYQACVDAAKSADVSDLDLSSWQLAWNGAEPVRASTLEQFRGTFSAVGFRAESLSPGFGLAEATLMVTSKNGTRQAFELTVDEVQLRNGHIRECALDHPRAKRLVSSGRAGRNTTLRIVQPETGRPSDPKDVGEIWISSDSVGQGYWKKPEETAATFGAFTAEGEGPFLRTGDLAFMHDGELFVTGRLKDVIVIRGVNYYPHDLEHTVEASHSALRPDTGAVVGLEDSGNVRLVVVHELRRDSWRSIRADEIVDAIRRAVAREHQLALDGVVLIKPFSLPKTSSGKVQRARCRAALRDQSLPSVHEWWRSTQRVAPIDFSGEPLTQPGVVERQLTDWLQRELSLTGLTWKTPLMELGVDSLKAVELSNALSASFNYSFSPTLIIDYPTVEALASLIREQILGVPRSPALAPVQPNAFNNEHTIAQQIESLDSNELDAVLQKSIDEVLGRGTA